MVLSKNSIPDDVKTVHLIAVCGTAMGALACILEELGFEVTGSDQNVYPPMSTYLGQRGIRIVDGFNGENLSHRPDLVVVGNAVTRDNPEAVRMREMGLNYCSLPQALNRFAAGSKQLIVVTGTHGKTTTSALMAWVLASAGLDPSFMIGGIVKNFSSNYRIGSGDFIVFEGDEYDTAYFDKGPKFLHFDPAVAVLTSVEFDHADIFRDLDHVKQAFGQFIASLSKGTTLLAHDTDTNISDLLSKGRCRVERYGLLPGSPWRIEKVDRKPPWTLFDVFKNNTPYGSFRTQLVGEHNLLNILSVIGAADRLAIPSSVVGTALESFKGIKRRQEVRGTQNGITVMDDFAHHPTAVRETIRAVKPFYPTGRLVAVFEPRTNTSMRAVFQKIYPQCFDPADVVCIREPSALWKVPKADRFSSEQLVKDLRDRGKAAYFFADTEAILPFLVETAKAGDVILIMSNGGFDNIHERLLELL